jgi:hypothetical protein
VLWVEALDEGDPKAKVEHRDQIMTWDLRETNLGHAKPKPLTKTEHRFAGLAFAEEKRYVALLTEYDRKTKHRRTFVIDPNDPDKHKLLWDLSVNEKYKNPGTPVMAPLPSGHTVLLTDVLGHKLLLHGQGATPDGDRPFLDECDPETGKTKRLFQSDGDSPAR